MWMSLWPCTHRNDHGLSWWQWSAKVQKMSRRSCRNMTKSSKYWLDLQIRQRSGHDLQNALEGLQWRSAPSKSVVMVLCWKTVDWPLQNYRRIGAQSTWYGRYTRLMTRQLSSEVKLSIYHFIQAPTVTCDHEVVTRRAGLQIEAATMGFLCWVSWIRDSVRS